MADLRELASFGKYKTGVNRPAFSKEDVAARSWLSKKMSESGLAASTDKYGTVIGRNPKVTRAVLVGSHSDTVPNGGWLDGSLGVIYGLEIARCFAEQGTSAVGADAISFQDEEGTFLALMGSRAFCGEDIAAEIASAKDKGGAALTEAIAKSGFRPGRYIAPRPSPPCRLFGKPHRTGPSPRTCRPTYRRRQRHRRDQNLPIPIPGPS